MVLYAQRKSIKCIAWVNVYTVAYNLKPSYFWLSFCQVYVKNLFGKFCVNTFKIYRAEVKFKAAEI